MQNAILAILAALALASPLSGAARAQSAPASAPPSQSAALPPLGIGLEGIEYPYPVRYLDLTLEGQPLRMAYMDVTPTVAPRSSIRSRSTTVRLPRSAERA